MILVDPSRRPRCALEAWLMHCLPEYLRELAGGPVDRVEAEALAAGEIVATMEWSP